MGSGAKVRFLAALAAGVSALSACSEDRVNGVVGGDNIATSSAPVNGDGTSGGQGAAGSFADASSAVVKDSGTVDAKRADASVAQGGSVVVGGAGGQNTSARDAGSGGTAGTTSQRPNNGCDLTGRWIATQRTLNEALFGAVVQSGHSWIYWEFDQRADQATIKKVLQCGEEVKDRSTSGLGAQITSSQAVWDGLTRNNKVTSAKATYAPQSGSEQCALAVEKMAVVRGATFSYFGAFNDNGFMHPIDESMQPAQGSTPGWEDWDNDGNPGVTYHVSGIATGDVYMVQRDLLEYSGLTEKHSDKFKLAVDRLHEQRVIGQNPSTLPSADVTSSDDAAQHFIWFARADGLLQWNLPADADDLAICAKMRELKDQLIPEGNQ
jgi:hypothetical protein